MIMVVLQQRMQNSADQLYKRCEVRESHEE